MADKKIPILRATDGTILKFFDALRDQFQFNQNYNIHVIASDVTLSPVGPEAIKLKELNGYTVRKTSISRGDAYISFDRSDDTSRFNAPDTINITNRNDHLSLDELIGVRTLIAETFEKNIPGTPADSNTLSEVVASHQLIVTRLEESLERISRKFAEERLRIQSEQDAFIRQKQGEFATREATLQAEISAERNALAAREKQLDDRTNMHARRGIRADMKNQLQSYASDFHLTENTQKMRRPIHVALWITVGTLLALAAPAALEVFDNSADTFALARLAVLTAIIVGALTWYLRWMNRWFDRHADAEFNLKQFELDVDRASWIVETAMEWRSSEHGTIPSHLLQGISRNLFALREQSRDENIHPADYIASAIFGSAAKAKLKIGDSEIELDRKAIKNLQKNEG